MKKHLVTLVFLATILSGCTSILHQLYPLEGTWQRTTKDGFAYESWEIKKPNLMLGKGYTGSGNETILLENLRLFIENGKIIYEATVPDQNGGKPVRFPMVEADRSNKEFIFENPAHDFPQRIVYQFIGVDSLHVRAVDLGGKGLDFGFHRVKK